MRSSFGRAANCWAGADFRSCATRRHATAKAPAECSGGASTKDDSSVVVGLSRRIWRKHEDATAANGGVPSGWPCYLIQHMWGDLENPAPAERQRRTSKFTYSRLGGPVGRSPAEPIKDSDSGAHSASIRTACTQFALVDREIVGHGPPDRFAAGWRECRSTMVGTAHPSDRGVREDSRHAREGIFSRHHRFPLRGNRGTGRRPRPPKNKTKAREFARLPACGSDQSRNDLPITTRSRWLRPSRRRFRT